MISFKQFIQEGMDLGVVLRVVLRRELSNKDVFEALKQGTRGAYHVELSIYESGDDLEGTHGSLQDMEHGFIGNLTDDPDTLALSKAASEKKMYPRGTEIIVDSSVKGGNFNPLDAGSVHARAALHIRDQLEKAFRYGSWASIHNYHG